MSWFVHSRKIFTSLSQRKEETKYQLESENLNFLKIKTVHMTANLLISQSASLQLYKVHTVSDKDPLKCGCFCRELWREATETFNSFSLRLILFWWTRTGRYCRESRIVRDRTGSQKRRMREKEEEEDEETWKGRRKATEGEWVTRVFVPDQSG